MRRQREERDVQVDSVYGTESEGPFQNKRVAPAPESDEARGRD